MNDHNVKGSKVSSLSKAKSALGDRNPTGRSSARIRNWMIIIRVRFKN